jgi:hypothetical protein
MVVITSTTDGNDRYNCRKNSRSLFVSWTPAAKHNQLTSQRGILASSRLIGLNGAINSLKTKKSSATIVADVM